MPSVLAGKSNSFFVFGEIDRWLVDDLIFYTENSMIDKESVLRVFINSSGGSLQDAQAFLGVLQQHFPEVETYAVGSVFSAATVIFLAAKREKRFASPGSLFLLHSPFITVTGNKDELAKYAGDIAVYEEALISTYAGKLSIPREEIEKIVTAGNLLSAEKAVSIGLAGSIMNQNDDGVLDEVKLTVMNFANNKGRAEMAGAESTENAVKADVKDKPAVAERRVSVADYFDLISKGVDADVVKNAYENGEAAGDLCLRLIREHGWGGRVQDNEASKPQAAAGQHVEAKMEAPHWSRPAVQPQNAALSKPIDEVADYYEKNASARNAFNSLDKFRAFCEAQDKGRN
jgi:ATP-dependent Clp protease protease subunit